MQSYAHIATLRLAVCNGIARALCYEDEIAK
jgi:hypothetical protein